MSLLAPAELPPLPPAVVVKATPEAEAARRRGLAALRDRRWVAASAALETAVKLERRWPDAYVALGYSYLQRSQPGMAFVPLREGLRLAPGDGPAWRELARCFYLLRRYARAQDAGRQATHLRPRDGEAWLLLGLAEAQLAEPLGALPALAQAGALRPTDALPRRVRGEVLLGAGRPAEAEPALKTALRLDPRDARARRALGRTLHALGRPGEAAALGLLRDGQAP